MKPKVKDSDLQMCRSCSGTGQVKETSNHRVFESECSECGGEGWVGSFKLTITEVEAEDVEVVTGAAEVELQKEVLTWVKNKYGNDEKKFAAFLRFTMAYGRSQCDAKEFHEFLRDAFGMDGAVYIAPKLAKLVKDKLYRTNLLKVNAAVHEQHEKKKASQVAKKHAASNPEGKATQEIIEKVEAGNNNLCVEAAEPPPPPIN